MFFLCKDTGSGENIRRLAGSIDSPRRSCCTVSHVLAAIPAVAILVVGQYDSGLQMQARYLATFTYTGRSNVKLIRRALIYVIRESDLISWVI